MGQKINLTSKDGFHFGAYLAEPEKETGGGLVICQEIFGATNYLRSACDFYADAGYLTIAPQFFDRAERDVCIENASEGIDRAQKLKGKIDLDVALDDLEAARDYLRSVGVRKVGVVGFCWGGTLSWLFACRRTIDCAVSYYGGGIPNYPGEQARPPLIMHIGDADHVITRDKLELIKKAEPDIPIYIYPNAPHGFDNSQRDGYDPATASLARERTLEFLKRHLE